MRGGEIKESTTHVEAGVELFRDAGSIPAASTLIAVSRFCAELCERRGRGLEPASLLLLRLASSIAIYSLGAACALKCVPLFTSFSNRSPSELLSSLLTDKTIQMTANFSTRPSSWWDSLPRGDERLKS